MSGGAGANAIGVDILDGLGSTEMLHIFLSNRMGEVRYGTTGKPVPGYDVRLVDDDGEPVAPGEMGELQVRGPTSAVMYWNNREQSRATFLGEWTRSGDKYIEDKDGYYVYCGRRDDMLKVGGIYVAPFEVEGALLEPPRRARSRGGGVAGRGSPDQAQGLRGAQAGRRRGRRRPRARCRSIAGSELAAYKYPRWIEFRTELPKTATGKIQRFKLRAEAP